MSTPASKDTSRKRRNRIIRGVLVAALVIFAAVLLWMYKQNPSLFSLQQTPDTKEMPKEQKPIDESPGEEPISSQYVVLEDWGVRFRKDAKLIDTDVIITKSEEEDVYQLTTSRIQSLGGRCAQKPHNTVSLLRKPERPSPPWTPGNRPPINEQPIAGYFYIIYEPIVACSGFDSNGNLTSVNTIETQDKDALSKSLNTISMY